MPTTVERTLTLTPAGTAAMLRAAAMIFGTIVAVLTLSTSASAETGREAVGRCIDTNGPGSRCAWSVNAKGEHDICDRNGCKYCASATSECVAASEGRPKPSTMLPVGTTVVTELGAFTIQPATPVTQATDGLTAVGKCLDNFASGGNCTWSLNKGGSIDICDGEECVSYASATSTYPKPLKGRPRPTTALPVGAEVLTTAGCFKTRRS